MTMTAGDIIQAARDEHPAFNEVLVAPAMAWRWLQEIQLALVEEARRADATYLPTGVTITMGTDVNGNRTGTVGAGSPELLLAGFTLPSHLTVLGGTIYLDSARQLRDDLALVPWADRHQPEGRYPAYERNQKLFLCGRDADWLQVVTIDLDYTAIPTAPAAAASVLALPDSARSASVAALALAMARRAVALKVELDFPYFQTKDAKATASWLQSVRRMGQPRVKYVREVV